MVDDGWQYAEFEWMVWVDVTEVGRGVVKASTMFDCMQNNARNKRKIGRIIVILRMVFNDQLRI